MGQIDISGSLIGGPPSGGDTFPAAQFITPLKLSTSPKGFQSATGVLTRQLNDAGVFVALSAVGADVPRANTLYTKMAGDYQLRITQDDGAGGTTVVTLQLRGLFIMEVPDGRAITLLEIAASGQMEYLASGAV